jgi:hypothetical protein
MRMWYPIVSASPFLSRVNTQNDETATGKWLVPVPLRDPDETWDDIQDASAGGIFVAAKISGPKLDAILGHKLVCVYSRTSDENAVAEVLRHLREIGVKGDLRYKSDKATAEGRDEYLWTSRQFEVPAIAP